MTTIELIRAEIERRIKSIDSCPFIEAEFGAEVRREGKLQAYKGLLSFLDTMQEVEYIRKDALLEWLRERINLCDNSVAMKRAYEKLIENIQAL